VRTQMLTAMVLVLALAGASTATTLIPMSVEELTRAADTVVEATATNSWSQWNPQHTMIVTYTRFTVLKTLKGAPPAEILVKQPGGMVGSDGTKVPGVRHFLVGETALLFLEPSRNNDGTQLVVGLVQGNFRVYKARSGVMAANGMPGVSALHTGGAITEYRGTTMRLDEMESRVQGRSK
jgi:hypothetical protein